MEIDITNIRAEFLLNYLYHEESSKWVVKHMGRFYRNYQGDVISIDEEQRRVELSRDNFIRLLPEGLFDRARYGGRQKSSVQEDRKEMERLCEVFTAVDNVRFQGKLEYESYFAELHRDKVPFLLKFIYGYELSSQDDEYVRRVAHLILHRDIIKGDLPLIKEILSSLLECEVNLERGEYYENRWAQSAVPQAIYRLEFADLTPDHYLDLQRRLNPLFEFMREWFIPIDLMVEFRIVDFATKATSTEATSTGVILGYNTKITNNKG